MNNTFNFQRFGLLLKRQWLEFGKIYLISLGVSLGVIIAFYTISLWAVLNLQDSFDIRELEFRVPLFLALGFLFISIIASYYFAHLGQKAKAIIELMIPASTFEKFLSGIFFTGLLSTVSFLVLFVLTDLAFVAKLRTIADAKSAEGLDYIFGRVSYMPAFVYVIPFFVTSVFLLGSIYFNKFHYIKTAVAVMIFAGAWTYIVINTVEYLMKNRIPIEQSAYNSQDTAFFWIGILFSVLTLIFWAIAFVRLKEKEV